MITFHVDQGVTWVNQDLGGSAMAWTKEGLLHDHQIVWTKQWGLGA